MEARRDVILTTTLNRLKNETTASYPFEQAQADLVEFFYAGTLAGGLQELAKQTGTQANQNAQALQKEMLASASKQDLLDATASNQAIRQALTKIPLKSQADTLGATSWIFQWIMQKSEGSIDGASADPYASVRPSRLYV